MTENQDYAGHEKTYNGFIAMFTYGTVAVVGVLVLMAIFLV